LEGDPAEALVELPDGRLGTIPTDRLTVAEPPEGSAYIGDGTLASVGDMVGHTDAPGFHEIKSINADGSITVGHPDHEDSNQDMDPSTLTRTEEMHSDSVPELDRMAEEGTEEPPSEDAAKLPEHVRVQLQVAMRASSRADQTGSLEDHSIAGRELNTTLAQMLRAGMDAEDSRVVRVRELLGHHSAEMERLEGGNAPQGDEPEIPDHVVGIQEQFEQASQAAESTGDGQAYEAAVYLGGQLRERLVNAGFDEDGATISELDERIRRYREAAYGDEDEIIYEDVDEDYEYDPGDVDPGWDDEDDAEVEDPAPATATDADGHKLEVDDFIDVNGERMQISHINPNTGVITYVNPEARYPSPHVIHSSEVIFIDSTAVDGDSEGVTSEQFLPSGFDPANYSDWGDRAADIAASPGPRLELLQQALSGNDRQALKDAIHAAYNGPTGLGRIGAKVEFRTVSRMDTAVQLSGRITTPDGRHIGEITRTFHFDDINDFNRVTEVHNDYLTIDPSFQGQGIASDLYRNQENWFIRDGVDKVSILANIDVGGYAWARAGFDYKNQAEAMRHIGRLRARAEDAGYTEVATRLNTEFRLMENNPNYYPTPFELSRLGYTPGARTWPGKEIMLGTNWDAVKHLRPPQGESSEQRIAS
jgi:GNAT superfamily N-acetyltransferase